jgi:hypothetical protein
VQLIGEGVHVILHPESVLQEVIFLNQGYLLPSGDHGSEHRVGDPLLVQPKDAIQRGLQGYAHLP